MALQNFSIMRSVSLTREQSDALDKQASIEDRKVSSLIRVAVIRYLEGTGALKSQTVEDPDEDEE